MAKFKWLKTGRKPEKKLKKSDNNDESSLDITDDKLNTGTDSDSSDSYNDNRKLPNSPNKTLQNVLKKTHGKKQMKQLSNDSSSEMNSKGVSRHVIALREALGLTDEEIKRIKEPRIQAETRFMQCVNSHTSRPPPEIIVFEDPTRKKKKAGEELPAKLKKQKVSEVEKAAEFDLKSARHEVQRLGIRGLDDASKQTATVSMLVKLGAAPPKNSYLNYKEYQAIKRKEKQDLDSKRTNRDVGGSFSGSLASKNTTKKKKVPTATLR